MGPSELGWKVIELIVYLAGGAITFAFFINRKTATLTAQGVSTQASIEDLKKAFQEHEKKDDTRFQHQEQNLKDSVNKFESKLDTHIQNRRDDTMRMYDKLDNITKSVSDFRVEVARKENGNKSTS